MQSSHNALRRNIISNWFYDVIALRVDALSKQLHQALVFGEDADVIYLHFCDLNTQFDFTVPSLQFLRLNVVFGHFIFVSSLVERLLRKSKRKLSFLLVGKGKLFITKLFFEEFNLIFFTVERLACFEMQPRRRRFWEFWGIYFFYSMVKKITFLKGNLPVFINVL